MFSILRIVFIGITLLGVTNCGSPKTQTTPKTINPSKKPMRIISLDFCADQYVLKLANRDSILALSSDATKEFSYLRQGAKNISRIKPIAENVLLQKPDLIVRSYGGGPNATHFYEDVGIPVLNVGWAGQINDIQKITMDVAIALGEAERGQALIEQMNRRLEKIQVQPTPNPRPTLLYLTPTGYTTGTGSLVHEAIEMAGFDNFSQYQGWHPIPLERLAGEQPDYIAASFFDLQANHPAAWSAIRHPLARKLLQERRTISLEGSWTACGAWFILDAVETLLTQRQTISKHTN